MWFLRNISTGNCFYLTDKPKYAVGKINADLVLQDDSSISRSHAQLYVSRADTDNGTAVLQLIDVGSKYGTFLDDGITSNTCIAKKQLTQLNDGTRVRFGVLQCVWDVCHQPLESMASGLPLGESQFLEQCLNSLGGKLQTSWQPSCTHLTMSEMRITVKLLYALLAQIPVVTIQYWRDLSEAVKNQSKVLPRPRKYAPPCSDYVLKNQLIDLSGRAERSTLFADTTFVFMNRRQYEMYAPLITKTGGTSKNLNKGVAKPMLLKSKVVVIQYVPSTESQCSQTISSIEEYLQFHGRRIIPEYEIGLAIVFCSTVKYCNPEYKIVSDLMPSSSKMEEPSAGGLLAPNTHSHACSNSSQDDVNIAETEVNSQIPPRPSVQQESAVIDLDVDINNIEVLPILRKSSSPVKRKHNSDEEDENLFTFSENMKSSSPPAEKGSKRICMEASTKRLTVKIQKVTDPNNKTVSTTGFLNKSGIRKTQEAAPVPTEQPTSKKRAHIAVLTDDDDDDDNDLFNFNDDNINSKRSPSKRPRLNQSVMSVHNDLDDGGGDLFNFTPNQTQTNGAAKVTMRTMTTSVKKATTCPKTPKNSLPKPKELPKRINTGNWLHTSLHKLDIKDELDQVDDKVNAKIKLEDQSLDSSVDQTWLNSLKKGLSIRTLNVSLCDTRREYINNQSNSAPTTSSAVESTKKNFKTFVKAYQRPSGIVIL